MIYISEETDIHFNLAFEKYLIEKKDGFSLFLWQNAPSVIIGRYQNPYEECNLVAMKEDNVKLARRYSGGGAVYHDLGNVCFTIIDDKDSISIKKNFECVVKALEALGIKAEVSGRNDITVNGKKVSGSAFQHTRERSCHHGTMLLNSDLEIFSRYLTPSREKLESHSVKSVSSRVANLGIEKEPFIKAMENSFGQGGKTTAVSAILLKTNDYIKEQYELLSSEDWLLGKSPKFTNRFDIEKNGQKYTVCAFVEKDIIKNVEIYTDSLDVAAVENIKKDLTGRSFITYISSSGTSSSR